MWPYLEYPVPYKNGYRNYRTFWEKRDVDPERDGDVGLNRYGTPREFLPDGRAVVYGVTHINNPPDNQYGESGEADVVESLPVSRTQNNQNCILQ